MINNTNFIKLLNILGFNKIDDVYEKEYHSGCKIVINEKNKEIIYPEDSGLIINDKTTCNFSHNENFVVFECIDRLLSKGYRPEHIELEKKWTIGHEQKSGKADIIVYTEDRSSILAIIECKTYGNEFKNALKKTYDDGGQLFSYWQQERSTKWLVLYASTISDDRVECEVETVSCSDDPNLLELSKKDDTLLIYKNAYTVKDLFATWDETYEKKVLGNTIFDEDSNPYQIGVKPLRKKDLKDFSNDDKIVNKFEEILRHNNVSDKENAFNRLTALFICKLVDEINKEPNDEVEFQYKIGTDTYESLQDRLQKLHQQGMDEFMKEKIFYVADDYAENLVKQYTNQRREKMIEELNKTIRILKFYSNNDFAFKDVHNEELFYQNGKVLVEVVQLFEKFRIIDSNSLQLLGDLFEQLLNKGFKQNEGQFFTPTPITRFIWKSLPLKSYIFKNDKTVYPKIIDYACGAGHFLTEGYEEINNLLIEKGINQTKNWIEKKLYGIEKDYRLARVSRISLFMHGAGNGNIIFGDGLECYPEKSIENNSFDILVANPPYSVSAFKPHLKLKNNNLEILDYISLDGSEIETLFVERISQLVKPNGMAAVVLPSSILNKDNPGSYVRARESILKNFMIKSIVQFGSKTFGATGTNTVVLFLEKYNEPPKRSEIIQDSVTAIFNSKDCKDWEDEEIMNAYLERINVAKDVYYSFISCKNNFRTYELNEYFSKYYYEFIKLKEYSTKISQATFKKLDDESKLSILNQMFYKYAIQIEQEKIYYFALAYTQRTLVVNSPTDNSEQEKFLGYKWSNRKGQEGIQIINAGGMLYGTNSKLSNVIQKHFLGDEEYIDGLQHYYFFECLDKLIDFDNVKFNKSIKLIKSKKMKTDPKYNNFKLSDSKSFTLQIGNRVLSEELDNSASIPVYSANVHEPFGKINKKNINDFSLPSILWGIDGDWMVDVLEENIPFYPTDHCGVLRVLNPDINVYYLSYALLYEGMNERFSRSNRASIDRIKNLLIQLPPKHEQISFVDKIKQIDKEIYQLDKLLEKYENDIKSKFVEMFGDNNKNIQQLTVSDVKSIVTKGTTPTTLGFKFDINGTINFIKVENITDNGDFLGPFDKISEECNSAMLRSELQAEDILVSIAGTLGKTAIVDEGILPANTNQAVAVIRLDKSKTILPEYLYYYLKHDSAFSQFDDMKKIANRANLSLENIDNIKIPNYSKELQHEFINYAKSCDKLKFDVQCKKEKLLSEKKEILEKEFK